MWIQVLGPLSVRLDTVPVLLGGFKQRVVFALLALRSPQFVGVNQLIDDLWPDDPPGRPRKTLQVYIANLRRELGAGRIASGPGGYRLHIGADESDLARFVRLGRPEAALEPAAGDPRRIADLEAALATWTGPALAELCGNTAVSQLVTPLNERRAEIVEEVLTAQVGRGLGPSLIPRLIRQVADEPWRERSWGLLMQAYVQAGRQSDALQTYQHLRRTLADELGVEPGPPLRRLHLQILRQERVVTPPAGVPVEGTPTCVDERRTATLLTAEMPDWDQTIMTTDAEDLAQRSDRLCMAGARAVAEFGGQLLSRADGRISAVFGHPYASDDDPQRAIRAALQLRRNTPTRVGVHTGLVVVSASAQLSGGATNKTSADLAAAAGSGQILISATTAALVAGRFVLEAQLAEPSQPTNFRVLDEVEPDLVAVALAGRESEVAQLTAALSAPNATTVTLLHGEAGIGKSALLAYAANRLRPPSVATVLLRADRQRSLRSLHPVAAALRHRYRGPDQCEADLTLLGTPAQAARSLTSRLAEIAEWSPRESAKPATRASSTSQEVATTSHDRIEAALAWLGVLGDRQPLWLLVEDLHVADDDTLRMLAAAPDQVGQLTILMTSRVEEPPAELIARTRLIGLSRLAPPAARTLVVEAARPARLRLAMVNRIVGLGAGHPLYLQTLARDAETAAGAVTGPSSVPLALDGILRARLDRLGPLKPIAQRCAVLGSTFDLPGAQLVCTLAPVAADADAVADHLFALVEAGILIRLDSRAPNSTTYAFSHELIAQTAYDSLPRALRTELHGRIADRLAGVDHADAAELARHLEQSGNAALSAARWVQAGKSALDAGRLAEASALLRRGLALMDTIPPGPARDQLELTAQILLIWSLNLIITYSAELEGAIDRAVRLAIDLERPEVLAHAMAASLNLWQTTGRYPAAAEVGARLVALTEGLGDHRLHTRSLQYYGATLALMGFVDRAHALIRPTRVAIDVAQGSSARERYAVCAELVITASVARAAGDRNAGDDWFDLAEQIAADDGGSAGLANLSRAIWCQLDGDAVRVRVLAEPELDRAVMTGSDWYYTWALALLGWVRAVQQDPAEGLSMLEDAIAHSAPVHQFGTFFLLLAGQAERLAGRDEAAAHRLAEARAESDRTGEAMFLPYIVREQSRLLQEAGRFTEAEESRRHACELAKRQGNGHFAIDGGVVPARS